MITAKSKKFLSPIIAKALEKNYKFVTHGDISLKMMLEEGHPYEDYQFINKEARKFAETIVFELVRRNYDPENCYDEEEKIKTSNTVRKWQEKREKYLV